MTSASAGKQLAQLLSAETSCMNQLIEALEQEKKALADNRVEHIENATRAKEHALTAQIEASTARHSFTARLSNENDLDSLVRNNYYSNREELLQLLQQLNELSENCKNLNNSNGRLINQKQQQTRQALNIIRQSENSTPTYSDHGSSSPMKEGRSLGKA